MTTQQAVTAPEMPPEQRTRIGLEVGPLGRGYRAVTGLAATAAGVVGLVTDASLSPRFVALTVAAFAGIAVFYLLLHGLLGEPVLRRVDPFVAAVIVLGTLGAIAALPSPTGYAVQIYVGLSLLVAASIRYGGCEVIALPSLLFHRRYVVYCPINILDAAERPLRRSAADPLLRAAAIVALIVGSYYLFVQRSLVRFEVADPMPRWVALILLLPAVVVGLRAWQAREDRQRGFILALGTAALVAGALNFSNIVDYHTLFALAVLIGLLAVAYRKLRSVLAARRTAA